MPKPDPQICGDCWEEDCRGCETWEAAHFYAKDAEIDVDAVE